MTDPDQAHDQLDAPIFQPDAVVTRSEERLFVTTHRRETRRARLVKFVEAEAQTRTVDVRREQVRIEYEPILEEDAALSSPAAGTAPSGEGWLVLYDEEIVVQRRWVARERVRLAVHSVTEDREISEDVRREQTEIVDTTYGG